MNYTIIYTESFIRGSHWHSFTKMKRVSKKIPNQSLESLIEENDLDPAQVLLVFEGHPELVKGW